ncbi:MAG TPA: DoxX family protein [Gemmatimonadaceae bacterium]|nr:DoxX family protein [Gemmatimonadaceae bacterium]
MAITEDVDAPVVTTTTHRRDFTPAALAILRIGAGLLFMQHGLQKLFGMFGGFGGTPGATAPLDSLMGVAGILEVVGGALLVAGLFVRPVALILLVEMVVAYFQAHLPQGGMPIQNGGELALLYALVFGFLAARGAGPVSVDARRLHYRHEVARRERVRAA